MNMPNNPDYKPEHAPSVVWVVLPTPPYMTLASSVI